MTRRADLIDLNFAERELIKRAAYAGAGAPMANLLIDLLDACDAPPLLEYAQSWCLKDIEIYRGGIVTESIKDTMREIWLRPIDKSVVRLDLRKTRRAEEIYLLPSEIKLLRRMVKAGAGGIACLMLVHWLNQSNDRSFRQYGPLWIKNWGGHTWGLPALARVWPGLFPGGLYA